MGLFGADEYTDYTLLKKKGLLKLPDEKQENIKVEGGFVDLTGSTPANNPVTNDNNTNFLSDMASIGNANPLANFDNIGGVSSTTSINDSNSNINGLKLKLEDLEYKLERMIERLEKIEVRLGG